MANGLTFFFGLPVLGSIVEENGTSTVFIPRVMPPSQKHRVPSNFSLTRRPAMICFFRFFGSFGLYVSASCRNSRRAMGVVPGCYSTGMVSIRK